MASRYCRSSPRTSGTESEFFRLTASNFPVVSISLQLIDIPKSFLAETIIPSGASGFVGANFKKYELHAVIIPYIFVHLISREYCPSSSNCGTVKLHALPGTMPVL